MDGCTSWCLFVGLKEWVRFHPKKMKMFCASQGYRGGWGYFGSQPNQLYQNYCWGFLFSPFSCFWHAYRSASCKNTWMLWETSRSAFIRGIWRKIQPQDTSVLCVYMQEAQAWSNKAHPGTVMPAVLPHHLHHRNLLNNIPPLFYLCAESLCYNWCENERGLV